MKAPNRYKPGQLITIEGKLYRVAMTEIVYSVCPRCAFTSTPRNEGPCRKFCFNPRPKKYIPVNCYLKPVKLCIKQDS